jgi:hypothetical protein
MPKYQNTQKFIQPLKFGGTRILVKPGEIISIAKELDLNLYPFLTKVEDSVKETKKVEDIIKNQQKPQQVVPLSKDEHEKVRSEQEKINEDIYKKIKILKDAIETLNVALSNLENEVYGNDVVIENEGDA